MCCVSWNKFAVHNSKPIPTCAMRQSKQTKAVFALLKLLTSTTEESIHDMFHVMLSYGLLKWRECSRFSNVSMGLLGVGACVEGFAHEPK